MDPNGDGDPSDGIDGWRLDVPDEVTPYFWREWRTLVKSINPEAVIIGEIWGEPSRWLRGDQFDSVMNYEFHAKPQYEFWTGAKKASDLANNLRRYGNLIPAQSAQVMMNILDSHDTDRWFSMLENPGRPYDGQNRPQDGVKNYKESKPGERAYLRGLAAVTLQYALPGAPNIWYGTEQGMWGADDPHDRKPMWWEDKPNDDPEERPIVAVKAHYQSMAAIRKSNLVLSRGSLEVMGSDDNSNTLYFRRDYRDEAALVAVNGSDKEQTVTLGMTKVEDMEAKWEVVHAGTRWPKPTANRKANPQLQAKNGRVEVMVPAGDCVILIRRR
jgi:glycosidase